MLVEIRDSVHENRHGALKESAANPVQAELLEGPGLLLGRHPVPNSCQRSEQSAAAELDNPELWNSIGLKWFLVYALLKCRLYQLLGGGKQVIAQQQTASTSSPTVTLSPWNSTLPYRLSTMLHDFTLKRHGTVKPFD